MTTLHVVARGNRWGVTARESPENSQGKIALPPEAVESPWPLMACRRRIQATTQPGERAAWQLIDDIITGAEVAPEGTRWIE